MLLEEKILDKFKTLFAPDAQRIALHEPNFKGNEWQYVKDCLDTGWVSTVGQYVDKFEHDLAEYTGAAHAIATTNCTAALHVCYLLAGIQPGDEVLVPTVTFIGTINPLLYCGATPHFIDADARSLGIDPIVLDHYLHEIVEIKSGVSMNRRTGRPITALCVMHTLGHPVDLDPIEALCEKYHLILLEDAAEALGSSYKGKHVGHRGLLGALSFNGNKIITTGGGGAILTNHSELAKRAKHITTTAKLPHAWAFHHDQVGYNYRLPNLNAAVGCAQLEQLPQFLQKKRILANHYADVFSDVSGVSVLHEPEYAASNYWLNAILLDEAQEAKRDAILQVLNHNAIMVRPLWELQHTQPMFQQCPKMPTPIAERMMNRIITIPSSAHLNPVPCAVSSV